MSRRDPITISDDEDDANQNFSIGSRRPGPSQATGSGRERRIRGSFSVLPFGHPSFAPPPVPNEFGDVAFQEDTTNRTPLNEDDVVHPLDELSGPPTHLLDGFTFVLEDGSTADLLNIDEPGYDQRIYAQGMVSVRSLEAQEEDDAEEQAAEPGAPAGYLFTKVGPITKWFAGDGVTEK